MLILLPPSQGKAEPPEGAPVDLAQLAFAPQLSAQRGRLLDAVDPGLREAPAAPAAEVYTGVLYGRLRLGELPEAAAARAAREVLIASALWGVLRPSDRIPAYRLDMGSKPAGIGALAAFWRPALGSALPDEGLVLDLRSSAYAAAWRPRRAVAVGVRGFTQRAGGERKVISHMVKRVRGDVARAALLAPEPPATPEELLDVLARAGMRVELAGRNLDVIETP